MRILVTAPTAFEIGPFKEKFPFADCLITGAGSVVTAYHLTKKIHSNQFNMIIQAGVAGSFVKEMALAEVVKVRADLFADLGAFEKNNFSSIFDLGLAERDEIPFKSGQLNNPFVDNYLKNIQSVDALTVNALTDESEKINLFSNKYHSQIETMEGAAFHYVCLLENIPFIQLRSISNYVGERDKSKWKLNEAIRQLNVTLIDLYASLV